MPPKGKLSDREIDTLTDVGEDGRAVAERRQSRRPPRRGKDHRRGPQVVVVPAGATAERPPTSETLAARNDIDRFIVAEAGTNSSLTPRPEADRRTLIRRRHVRPDGLPPTPEEVDAFVADASPDAYERLVDRLLAVPRYGERWARHWLDLVRYAESDGYRHDDYRPDAWRYRDYVIRAFNDDKPYDRFVQEQLAGDELVPGDPDALRRHRLPAALDLRVQPARRAAASGTIILNDITDTTGDVFLGLGMRLRPLPRPQVRPDPAEGLLPPAGVLRRHPAARRSDRRATDRPSAPITRRNCAAWKEKTADLRAEIDEIEAPLSQRRPTEDAISKFPPDIQAMIHKPAPSDRRWSSSSPSWPTARSTYEYDRLDTPAQGRGQGASCLAFEQQLAEFDAIKPPPLPDWRSPSTDVGPQAAPVTIPKNGDASRSSRASSTFSTRSPATIAPLRRTRPAAARRWPQWLTRPDNPLTARVIVNRIWQHHFGRGLVASASDFGRLGETPTHPELLDWLARRFVRRNGWSLKQLHRLIVTAPPTGKSPTHPDAGGRPARRIRRTGCYWRGDMRRLDAEQIRDAVLAATGELDLNAGGPGRRSHASRGARSTPGHAQHPRPAARRLRRARIASPARRRATRPPRRCSRCC